MRKSLQCELLQYLFCFILFCSDRSDLYLALPKGSFFVTLMEFATEVILVIFKIKKSIDQYIFISGGVQTTL